MNKKIELINQHIDLLKSKKNKIIFYTFDTKGNPVGSIANIYETAKLLIELGYNACILQEPGENKMRADKETPDDTNMGLYDWLGEEYSNIPHYSMSDGNLTIGASDFIIIPEHLTNAMSSEEMKQLPCKKIVFLQSYRFVTDLLGFDYTGVVQWTNFGFNDVLTTNQKQADYIKKLFPSVNVMVITPNFADYFNQENNKPKSPIINIVSRDPMMGRRIIKEYFLRNPLYRFITFKELRGIPRIEFAKSLKEGFLTIWLDDISGFGTAPLEAMKCGSIVLGKLPNLIPNWVEEYDENNNVGLKNNGVWVSSDVEIADIAGTITKLFLEDSIPEDLFKGMDETSKSFNKDKSIKELNDSFNHLINDRVSELESLIKIIEEKEK